MDKLTAYLEDEDKLVSPIALVLGYTAITGVFFAASGLIAQLMGLKLRLFLAFVLLLAWTVFWTFKRYQIPRNKTGKLGIIIALTTENDEQRTRLKVDLEQKIIELINEDGLQDAVTVLLTKNYQAERLVPKLKKYLREVRRFDTEKGYQIPNKLQIAWTRLRSKIKGHLYIFGRVSRRMSGESSYFLDADAMVVHPPLTASIRIELTQDFANIWGSIQFLEKLERQGFDFAARYWFLAAKYLIGCAAFSSNDMPTALQLHETVLRETKILPGHPNLSKIRRRVTTLLAQEHALLAYASYESGDTRLAKRHVDQSLKYDASNYDAHLIKAIYEFVEEKNPKKALTTVQAISKFAGKNRTWEYSKAFLLMYLERFDEALQLYDELANSSYEDEPHVIPQIIGFNENRLRKEPTKIQSHFILGFVEYKKNGNAAVALDHFERFLDEAKRRDNFRPLIRDAEKYLSEIRSLMNLAV